MFKVELERGDGFTDQEWELECEAAYWWAKCWNDTGFQSKVLNYGYVLREYVSGSLWWKKYQYVSHQGFTYTDENPVAILAKMLAGAEVLTPVVDNTAQVPLECGNQRGVLGWTYANTLTEWVSRWFLDSAKIWDIAGNRAHEYMHKLGYDHPFKATYDRDFSVPYALGQLTLEWIQANYKPDEFAQSAS